jgi:hypothetical protein
MLEAVASGGLSNFNLSTTVLTIGSLGTAAYGVVDVSKGFWGGISNRGFGDIKKVLSNFIPPGGTEASGLGRASALATLRANWLNGMALADQKAVAKALVKLNLTEMTARGMAATAGVDADLLVSVATKFATAEPLTQQETDVYGRFDLLVTALLDQGYQRGDQRYRNSAKLLAVPVSLALAVMGARAMGITGADLWRAVIAGLLATPLAPVAKDLSSAIQAGAKVAQTLKK